MLQQLAQGNGLEWEITPNTSLEELQSGIHAMARKGAAIRLISHQYELNKLTEAVFLLGSANLGFQRAAFRGIQRLNLSWDQATKVPTFASFVADQGSIKPVAAREFLFTQNMSQEEFQAQIGRAKATGYQLDFSNSKFNAAGQLQSLYVISPEFVSVHWDNFEEDQGSLLTLFGHQEQLLGLNLESAKVTLNAANNIAEAVIKEDPVEEIVEEENFVLEVRTNFKMTDPNSDFSASGGGLRYIMRDPDLTQEELPVPPPIVEEIHEEPIRIELDIKEHEVGGSKAKPLAFLSPNKGKKVPLIVINGKPYPNREKGLKALQALDPTKIKYVQVWKKGQKAHLYGDYPHGVVEIIMKGYMPEVKVGEKPVVKPIEKEIASPFKSGLKPGLVFVMIDGKPFEYREGKPFSVAFKVIKEKGWKEIGAIVIREPGSKAGSPLATDVPVVHLLTPEYEELYFAREKANDQTRIRLRNGKPGEPLYVIDGIPMKAEGLKQVEPNEIEMVSVLKNQAATAIYGSSGENGVVIISTKNNTEKGHEWEPNLEEGEIMFIVDGKEHKAHSFAELQISMEDIAYIQPLKLEDIAYIQPLKKEIARERYGLEQAVAITTLSSMGLPHHKDDPKKPSVGATPFLERVELKVYPNRVQDKAQIEFSLPESAPLGLRILDMQGKTVDILAEEKAEAGPKRYTWSTQGKADGTYLVQLRIGNEVTAKRIVVKK
ncbi:MAG: TonB-dependent receptor plug domain-containing protein [Bacteroidota bacterium]